MENKYCPYEQRKKTYSFGFLLLKMLNFKAFVNNNAINSGSKVIQYHDIVKCENSLNIALFSNQTQPLIQFNNISSYSFMNIKQLLIGIIGIAFIIEQIEGGCSPITQLQSFYSTEISIMQMHKDASNSIQTRYNYIFNFPVSLLHNSKASNLQSILAIHNLHWNYNPGYIKYGLSKFYSETAILISFQAQKIQWNKFSISLLINDKQIRPQIYFGQLYYDGTGKQTERNIKAVAKLQADRQYDRFVSYFTGIHASLHIPLQQLYQISVNQEIKSNNVLEFSIRLGKNTQLMSMAISFIAYSNPAKTAGYRIASGQMIFGSDVSGQRFAKIPEILPTDINHIFGISEIKFKKAYNEFELSFKSLQPNLFELRTSKSLNFLKISFFGVSISAAKACSECSFEKFFYSENQALFCVPKCPSNTKVNELDDKVCLKCPKQLNMELRDGGCFCKAGYLQDKGQCVLESEFSKIIIPTFSSSQSDCVDPKSIKQGGQCICKLGYQKSQNSGTCVSKCPSGYWNTTINNCTYCPPETFADEDIKQCISCGQYCTFCSGVNTCAFCQFGFTQNSKGKCVEICGDGKRNINECDDGNIQDNDGCSSSCQIQKGYQCVGGSANTQDKCSKVQYLISRANSQISGNGYIINYQISPEPELFTTEELKKIVWVKVSDAQAQLNPTLQARQVYYQIYPLQDPTKLSIIKIFIYFGNSNLTFNPKIDIKFLFPNDSSAQDQFIANIVSSNSYFSTRFSTRTLT